MYVCKLHIIKMDTAGNVVKKRKCCKSYSAQTNASNKVKHLLQDHDMELPTHLKEVIEEQQKQASLKKFFVTPQRLHSSTEKINSELQEIDKIALAYCMNPTVSFETISNSYWLAAFGEVLAPVRGKTNLKIAIKDFARRVQKDVKSLLTGILPLQMDGGKDINLRKLIASCVVIGGNALLYCTMLTSIGRPLVVTCQQFISCTVSCLTVALPRRLQSGSSHWNRAFTTPFATACPQNCYGRLCMCDGITSQSCECSNDFTLLKLTKMKTFHMIKEIRFKYYA